MKSSKLETDLAPTGIEGLDAALFGGLTRNRLYIVEGDPGVGKTTLAMQFLQAGVKTGERSLLISLAETSHELDAVAKSHDWDLSKIEKANLGPAEFGDETDYSILSSSEVELNETMKSILAEIARHQPDRVVIDSLSELRLLAQDALRFRRQILGLKHVCNVQNCTLLLINDHTLENRDLSLHSIAHGVVELQRYSPPYGKARRKMQIVKMRGSDFQAGYHDFNIIRGGIEVYPRLIAANYHREFVRERVTCGIKGLDDLLGGGVDRGTTTLLLGPAGCGKSSLSVLFAVVAAERKEKTVIFTFDEGIGTLLERAANLEMPLDAHIASGLVRVQQVDPAEMSPGEFMWHVKNMVEKFGARTVIIDSLTGYLDAMPEAQFLTIQMHEMLTYLNQQGVISILTMAQHGYLGTGMESPADVSYLADTVVLLRYFESKGHIKKAISVAKKRSSAHESTIREFGLGPSRVQVGRALHDFDGILTGNPSFRGDSEKMLVPEVSTERR